MEPWLWAIQDADEAERRGDAAGALAAIRRRMHGPDGEVFWRPSRIRWLEQLVMLGPSGQDWVRARWVLAQAMQWPDERDRGPAGRSARATRVAVDLRGGLHRIAGGDEADRRIKVRDHDWVFRQVFLYELEGLNRFLRAGATPDLLAGAGRVREWVHAPMGAFRYLGAHGDCLTWLRVGTVGDVVVTPNIGTAFVLEPGDHALGRLVPVEDGVMFEGRVLAVPAEVAEDVATDPPRWLEVLRGAGDHLRSGRIEPHQGAWCGLLSDVPMAAVDMLLHPDPPGVGRSRPMSPQDKARAVLDLAAQGRRWSLLLEELESRAGIEEQLRDLEGFHEGLGTPVVVIHGALTEPAVVAALPDVVGLDDRPVLAWAVDVLAEPARTHVSRTLAALDQVA